MMAVVKEGQAPYAPAPSVMQVINGYRHKHPQTPFTTDNLQLLGVSHSLAPRTLQALELLDLVDGEGEPTEAMKALREASSDEFPARLADVVRAAYAEVFRYRDPATDSPDQLREVFRFYRPPSMQDRMMRLFYGLAREAGIIAEAPMVAKTNGGSPNATAKEKQPKAKVSTRPRGSSNPPAPPPTPPAPPKKELPPLVKALVEMLPAKDEAMSVDDAEWWFDMARRAFPKEYGYKPPTKDDR
jgi:hypothetical protein